MNNAVFGKTMEYVKKHRDSKLVTTETKRNYLGSESNHHTTKFFTEHLLVIEMKKTEILVNKAVYLGFSILELSKILIYQFCYDYVKSKYGKKAKLCYMDTDLFIVYIKQMIFTRIMQKMSKTWNSKLWIRKTVTKKKK